MLAEGFSTKLGRRGALVHYDAVNRRVRGRRGARLVALTSGGAIADNADYRVLLEPSETFIGTVNEDFAVESMAGDIFQLGNASWRILRINSGAVRVEDAHGQPPGIPFWLGEAPGRSNELSSAVSRLRVEAERRIAVSRNGTRPAETLAAWLAADMRPHRARARGSLLTTSPRFTSPSASSRHNRSSCWSAFSMNPGACSSCCIRRSAFG